MGLRFINKRTELKERILIIPKDNEEDLHKEERVKNKKEKKEVNMTNIEQVAAAEAAITNLEGEVKKVVKKDRGLIERTESSKIILTEDNRQVLND